MHFSLCLFIISLLHLAIFFTPTQQVAQQDNKRTIRINSITHEKKSNGQQKKRTSYSSKASSQASKKNDKKASVMTKAKPMSGLTAPSYPYLSKLNEEEGQIVVKVKIDKNGVISNKRIINSPGFIRLEQSVLKALSKFKYHPAKKGSSNVASEQTLTFNFELEK